eukprot:scaffold253990_cov31-Tisochrysis_lutea.AAC.1
MSFSAYRAVRSLGPEKFRAGERGRILARLALTALPCRMGSWALDKSSDLRDSADEVGGNMDSARPPA